MDAIQPTTTKERFAVLDALRGFALFGILLANLLSFFGLYVLPSEEVIALPILDRGVLFFIDMFVEGKFYSLFSMLFGIGFGLQAMRMQQTPGFFKTYWYRRMVILLAFGLTHMVFIWNGDILTLYALLGMLLPLFMNLSDRALIRWIVCLLVVPIPMFFLTYATSDWSFWGSLSRYSAELKTELGYGDLSNLEMRTSDSAREVFFGNFLNVIPRPMSYLTTGRYPQVLGLFLIGMYAARHLSPVAAGRVPLNRITIAAFVAGLLGSFAYAAIKLVIGGGYLPHTPIGALQAFAYFLGAPLMALAIGWVFITGWRRTSGAGVFAPLATLGRMALTNYLFQTSLSMALFFGYGLGLMGQLPFTLLPLFAFGILLIQWIMSHYWLRWQPQGPLESIWKKLAYARLAPRTTPSERTATGSVD